MRIKNIVKVMNMHALIRVESAKRTAEKYIVLENEVNNMIDNILNNRNLKLDKKYIKAREDKGTLNIFIGSDYGFCGSYNFQINKIISSVNDEDKILIGKKIDRNYENVLMSIYKEDFEENLEKITRIIRASIEKETYSKINITYFRYNKMGDFKIINKQLFPYKEYNEEGENDLGSYTDDFIYEGDITELLLDLLVLYIKYEIIIGNENSKATENIMRQENTSDSLKKIDEREEIEKIEIRKAKKKKEFEKVLENFTKLR